MLALGVPAPNAAFVAGIAIPGWLLTWLVTHRFVKHKLSEQVEPIGVRLGVAVLAATAERELAEQDKDPAVVQNARSKRLYRLMITDFLRTGPSGSWWANGKSAATLGAWLSTVPVAFFLWNLVQALPQRLTWSAGLLALVVAIATEIFRWIIAAFVFGALYAVLPGWIGLVKGAALALAWLTAALATEVLNAWLDSPADVPWLYRFLQPFVFLAVLGTWYDLKTVRDAGGTWHRLRELSGFGSHTELVTYLAPVALAAIALIQQASTGSGTDLATAVVNGFMAVIGGK